MSTQRPPSRTGRPMSRSGSAIPGGGLPAAGRPSTANRPPPTAIRVPTGMVPGTGSMRGSLPLASPGVLSAPIKVTDRPVTQQGLSGIKTGMKGPQRQILDKSYYLGILRSKMNEVTAETGKLQKEMDVYNQEKSVHLSYEKKAEGLATEIRDLRGQLADYNMVVDMLNTNTDIEDMIDNYNTLKAQNDAEAEAIDSIFTERRQTEDAVRAVEQHIDRQRRIAEEMVRSMSPEKQEKYVTMTTANEELLQELSVLQEEVDELLTRKDEYEREIGQSQLKQEVVRLHEVLSTLEKKRDAMEAEDKSRGTPLEERERLLKQIKDDNQEIASMDRQLAEVRERTRHITEQIRQVEQDSDGAQGEYLNKSKELKRKELEIDRFLEAYEENKAQLLERMGQTEENIVSLLELCSRNTLRLHQLDAVTASELRNMQEELVSKETEVVHSESTSRGLDTEVQQLQLDLEKVEQLDGKVSGELSSLRERVDAMETELLTYRDLDALRRAAEQKKTRLQGERACLIQRRDSFRHLLDDMTLKHEAEKTKLQENETHAQLTNLERKWQHLEQNNFAMREFIASKSQESDYTSVASHVFQQVSEYNKILIDSLQKKSN